MLKLLLYYCYIAIVIFSLSLPWMIYLFRFFSLFSYMCVLLLLFAVRFRVLIDVAIAQQPFHCEIEHRLGLNCFTSGPVSCRVRLDRGGYVPGETIGIWASVHNQSRVTIKRTKASLTEVSAKHVTKSLFFHFLFFLLVVCCYYIDRIAEKHLHAGLVFDALPRTLLSA